MNFLHISENSEEQQTDRYNILLIVAFEQTEQCSLYTTSYWPKQRTATHYCLAPKVELRSLQQMKIFHLHHTPKQHCCWVWLILKHNEMSLHQANTDLYFNGKQSIKSCYQEGVMLFFVDSKTIIDIKMALGCVTVHPFRWSTPHHIFPFFLFTWPDPQGSLSHYFYKMK